MTTPLIEAQKLSKRFPAGGAVGRRASNGVTAVDSVDLAIRRGEILGLVGESGSGKSTLGRLLVRLIEPSAGRVLFDGEDLAALTRRRLRRRRRELQIVFQDPSGALNPRMRVQDLVEEPQIVHSLGDRDGRRRRTLELLDEVGLAGMERRWPHQLSGGQRQRVAIARALACAPRFLVADEPVTALDLSIQAQILNLLARLQQAHELTLLLIAHDLSLVAHLADRVAVMYRGQIVELAPRDTIFSAPQHPHTGRLLAAHRELTESVPGRA